MSNWGGVGVGGLCGGAEGGRGPDVGHARRTGYGKARGEEIPQRGRTRKASQRGCWRRRELFMQSFVIGIRYARMRCRRGGLVTDCLSPCRHEFEVIADIVQDFTGI